MRIVAAPKASLVMFTLVKRVGIAFFLTSHFFRFTQRFRIFGHFINIFKVFWIFDNNICSIIREANAGYMVWCIPNIYTAYLLGKFGPKN